MTRIPATNLDRADFGAWRDGLSVELGNFSDLAARSWAEVRLIEIFPGVRLGDAVLILPFDWMPRGPSQRASARTVDPAKAGIPEDPKIAAARDESIRRALLALWLPHATLTGIRQSKPNTWLLNARVLFDVARWQLKHRPSADGSVFSHLTLSDVLTGLLPGIGGSERRRADVRTLLRSLIDAGQRGLLTDWPKIYADDPVVGSERETSHKNAPPIVRLEKKEAQSWQPFSDEFVTAMISRAMWFQRHLAKPLLECWTGLRAIAAEEEAAGRSTSHPSVVKRRAEYLRGFGWTDEQGVQIAELPFDLTKTVNGETRASREWPPYEPKVVFRLVTTLQALNLAMIAFCTGGRSGELGDARDLPRSPGVPRLISRTFKLIGDVGGEERDWPLHPAALRAYDIQCILARLVRAQGTDHLWVMTNMPGLGGPLLNLTEPLVAAVEHLGLTELAKPDRAHAHRWRHTVARLVALSVVGAPQVLLDLFGHRDLDMTLRYMLSDPDVVEDATKVARETALVLAEEAIAETLEGTVSGPAAEPLRQGLRGLGMRRGETAFGSVSLRETAEILTFNSRHWELVRPGVLCTKTLGEFGPCTRGRGAPDPGGCRTDCDHRLELGRAKRACKQALEALLAELAAAEQAGESMLSASLEGQILAQLKRWDEVRERVLTSNPAARRIWEGRGRE
ncbi:MAG: integrase [Xanthobacteraceae bacterium]|nr:integrase [Xanthobacteraceae bacterium]